MYQFQLTPSSCLQSCPLTLTSVSTVCLQVLVDDTPLAFLHQPNNGVPVLGFRGDPDDRLLQEAVLPLLQVSEVGSVCQGTNSMVVKQPYRIYATPYRVESCHGRGQASSVAAAGALVRHWAAGIYA